MVRGVEAHDVLLIITRGCYVQTLLAPYVAQSYAWITLLLLQARGDVATCLVTGNLEPIGWGKMKALGIDYLFSKPL
jgi:hypothetical protein